MVQPSLSKLLEKENINRYTLVVATAKCAREITDDYIRKMQAAFPDVDIRKEVGKMSAWCLNNPAKRKTGRGITRFINSWLASAQKEAEEKASKSGKSTNNIFLEIAEERHDNR